MTKSIIMKSANQRSNKEGRSEALTASHKAAKGTFVSSGKVVHTLKQQSRLLSDFTRKDKVKSEIVMDLAIDFAMF